MKAVLHVVLFAVFALFTVSAQAQDSIKITGVVTFPKSMVVPANFAAAVKANMKIYKYNFENGKLVNQQLAEGLNVYIT